MNKKAPIRLAVAGIIHETNTYTTSVTGATELKSFEQYQGQEIVEAFAGANHQVGGFIEGASKLGACLEPCYLGQATPSGTISTNAYAAMKQAIVSEIQRVLPIDGVLLALHGAGVAEGVEDIEGDIAQAVRDLVGQNVPIAAVYDLHGNVTIQMQETCDISLPCRLYPHTDFRDRGVEAVELILRMLDDELKPVSVIRRLPMLPYIVATQEGYIPFQVNELCRRLMEQSGVVDCSGFHGFPYADIAAPCPTVICTTNGDEQLAQRCVDKVAEWIWANRETFRPEYPSPEKGVAMALEHAGKPIVINEYADNPGGGTPGDGTHLLRALLDANPPPGECCFAAINDAAVVRQAQHAGVGATIRVSLGGKQGELQGSPIEVDAYVKSITDGRFANRPGAMFAGVKFDLGAMCRLIIQGIDVIVASRAEQIYDTEPFALHGLDVSGHKIIAIKGANHFRAYFNGMAEQIITVDSVGLSTANITSFPRSRLLGPFWPLQELDGPYRF
ncbi:M81 family metallopeptidase [Pseudomonas sp. WC1]|uniref:M81 family metallopeptidase n=1 Tax=Pseudomonas sp. WC1 TaxID=3424772 RepID=UPI003D329B53